MDRHEIWRRVAHDYQRLTELAPDGYEPVVEVFVLGRTKPVELGFVETRRPHDDPWIRFESSKGISADDPGARVQPTDYWLHVHENYLERIEVRLRRKGEKTSFGFSHEIALEESAEAGRTPE